MTELIVEPTLALYAQLIELTETTEAFYFQDFELEGKKYRIFNYRLSSYSDFLKPGALECRGIMFEVFDDILQSLVKARLVSRPMQKFFNLNENPMTMGLDLSKVDSIELKADGSLMSTYFHDGRVRMKSKGSLFSEQAVDAMKYLAATPRLYANLYDCEARGWTINLEWCAPFNRIVIGYDKPHLKVLNVRHRMTGKYMPRHVVEFLFDPEFVIDRVETNGLDTAEFVKSIPSMQDDIEGYIARIGDLWFKIKTEKYMSLHHAKDSINNPRRLFEAVLDEGVDDLRSMFAHDTLAISQIEEMQVKVTAMYNTLVAQCEEYYQTQKDNDRKTFAIGAQGLSLHGNKLLSIVMNLYQGKDPDYKGFLKSRYKEFGFKDTATEKKDE